MIMETDMSLPKDSMNTKEKLDENLELAQARLIRALWEVPNGNNLYEEGKTYNPKDGGKGLHAVCSNTFVDSLSQFFSSRLPFRSRCWLKNRFRC